jgi:hypothetical protein
MKKTTILAVILTIASFGAIAGGGKVNNPWQPVETGTDCVTFLPAGIDLDDCIELSSATSGITYFCETLETTVVCDPDPESDDEQGSSRTDVGREARDGSGNR